MIAACRNANATSDAGVVYWPNRSTVNRSRVSAFLNRRAARERINVNRPAAEMSKIADDRQDRRAPSTGTRVDNGAERCAIDPRAGMAIYITAHMYHRAVQKEKAGRAREKAVAPCCSRVVKRQKERGPWK